MENRSGPNGTEVPATLRLVTPDACDDPAFGWAPDPANDHEAHDELAELFIGGSPAARPAPEPPAAVRAPIEAVITGHLPVRGALWVRAYANVIAQSIAGPVGLVRVSPDRTCIELIGSSADAEPVHDAQTAIRAAARAAERWLLHFDELDQAVLIDTDLLDSITILSGADEPAIVGAYRLIKTISEQRESVDHVGVSIVGSAGEIAARAADRLEKATSQFLGFRLAARPPVTRIQPGRSTVLGEIDKRSDPAQILSLLTDPAGVAAPLDAPATVPATPNELLERAWPTAGMHRPDPSSIVPGMRPLDLPCPIAPDVELAFDDAGRLHVMAWWSPQTPAQLLRASAWSRVNLPLLVRVCGHLNSEQCAPAQHIVCEDLGVAADLRGTRTIVHLAQASDAAPVDGWICGRVN